MKIEPNKQDLLNQTNSKDSDPLVDTKSEKSSGSNNGKASDSVAITDNAKQLNALQESIGKLPVVDKQLVEDTTNKVNARALEILGNAEQRLASAEKIAAKLLNMEEQLPTTKK